MDLVVGTSVGSLIGALYASERNSFDLEWAAFQLKQEDLFDFRVLQAVLGMGLAKGELLEAFVKAKVKQKKIEELKIPFAAVATDLNWGHAGGARQGVDRAGGPRVVGHPGRLRAGEPRRQAARGRRRRGQHPDRRRAGEGRRPRHRRGHQRGRREREHQEHRRRDAPVDEHHVRGERRAPARRRGRGRRSRRSAASGCSTSAQKKQCMDAGIVAARAAVPKIRAAIEAWKVRKAAEAAGRS